VPCTKGKRAVPTGGESRTRRTKIDARTRPMSMPARSSNWQSLRWHRVGVQCADAFIGLICGGSQLSTSLREDDDGGVLLPKQLRRFESDARDRRR
jgi:hypothetical protein